MLGFSNAVNNKSFLHPSQGYRSEAYPRNSGYEAGKHPTWDTGPLQVIEAGINWIVNKNIQQNNLRI